MPIELRKINANNWYACTQLTATEEQKRHFPVSVVYWLAESAYCGFYPLAIYHDDLLVGFTAYAQDPEDGSYWIMAFLIDKKHQNQGIGTNALTAVIQWMKTEHGCRQIWLGHRPGNEAAARLYEKQGFREVARTGREIIRRLDMDLLH